MMFSVTSIIRVLGSYWLFTSNKRKDQKHRADHVDFRGVAGVFSVGMDWTVEVGKNKSCSNNELLEREAEVRAHAREKIF